MARVKAAINHEAAAIRYLKDASLARVGQRVSDDKQPNTDQKERREQRFGEDVAALNDEARIQGVNDCGDPRRASSEDALHQIEDGNGTQCINECLPDARGG